MKMLELMVGLGLWPFDAPVREIEPAEGQINDDMHYARRAIVLPGGLEPGDFDTGAVHPAQWPVSARRRDYH